MKMAIKVRWERVARVDTGRPRCWDLERASEVEGRCCSMTRVHTVGDVVLGSGVAATTTTAAAAAAASPAATTTTCLWRPVMFPR